MADTALAKALQETSRGKNLSDGMMKRIIKEYERMLVIPKKKNKTQLLLCPIGLVGAGKTTVMKPLARKLKLVRISGDEIRIILMKRGYNTKRTIEIAFHLFIKYLGKGFGIAIDSDSIAPDIRREIKKISTKNKITTLWIHINPSEKFIVNKLTNFKYKKGKGFENAEQALESFYRRKPLHKKYLREIRFDADFDTSRKDLSKQIEMFVANMQKRFLS